MNLPHLQKISVSYIYGVILSCFLMTLHRHLIRFASCAAIPPY